MEESADSALQGKAEGTPHGVPPMSLQLIDKPRQYLFGLCIHLQ